MNTLKSGVNKDQTKLKLCCHIWKIYNTLSIKFEKNNIIPQVVPTPSAYENLRTTYPSAQYSIFESGEKLLHYYDIPVLPRTILLLVRMIHNM